MSGLRRLAPVVLPLGVAGMLAVAGHPWRAVPVLVLTGITAVIMAAGVDVAGWVARGVDAVVRALSAALSWGFQAFMVLPVWVFNSVWHRNPGRPLGSAGGWVRPPGRPMQESARSFGTERSRSARAPLAQAGGPSRIVAAVGVVVMVVAADLALGVGFNRVIGSGPTAPPGSIRIEIPSFDDTTVDSAREVPRDPRADHPAMGSAPWAQDYFQELNSLGSTYWPFTLYRPRSFAGEHVNVRGWERLGHRPASDQGVPVVALFGGSAAFGEGQRDSRTIASHLSMLAEESGLPVLMRNFGQRGWVMWQEMTLYEQLLADGEVPDVALFYDGANDLTVQNEPVAGVPTHYDVEEYARRLAQPSATASRAAEDDLGRALVAWWQARSVAYRIAASLGVTGLPEASARVSEWKERPGWRERGVDVYVRSRSLVQHLSETHGVVDLFFWQPQRVTDQGYRDAASAVGPTTIDLSGVLDGREDVYLDFVHTNEEGARLVAEAMWGELEPAVSAWYERNG